MSTRDLDPETESEADRLRRLHDGIRTEVNEKLSHDVAGLRPNANAFNKICGIDPGASGAVAIFDIESSELRIYDMPTATMDVGKGRKARNRRLTSAVKLGALLREEEPDVLWLEDVAARPGQGVSSMFAFGRAVGVVEGVAGGLQIPVFHVTPQRWMGEFGVVGKSHIHGGGPGGIPTSRRMAASAFPEYARLFDRVKDDGRADAALIALYGAKHANGQVAGKYKGESLALRID